MLTRSPVNSSPVQEAWDVYDQTALFLLALYRHTAEHGDTPQLREERQRVAELGVHQWSRFQGLFLASEGVRSAA